MHPDTLVHIASTSLAGPALQPAAKRAADCLLAEARAVATEALATFAPVIASLLLAEPVS